MAKGKYEATGSTRSGNKRLLVAILAMVLVCGSAIGGTVAWLISAPDPVVNTFTYGDIGITLKETDTNLDGDDDPNTNEYRMMPGRTITKDPVVTVLSGSETMWLFVQLEESENFDDFLTYAVDGSWAVLEDVDGVYYRHITAEEVAQEELQIHVLAGDAVTVKDGVTKEQLNALNPEGEEAVYPTLTITAYAVQYAGNGTAAEAWEKIAPTQEP